MGTATRTGPSGTTEVTRHHVTSRDGTRIAWWRSGQGPPLVLVHGTSVDHDNWAGLRPHLEPRVTVHAIDRRGRGASGDGPEHGLQREYEDVAAVVDAVAVDAGEPVTLLGHSYGGPCALGAATLTDAIAGLILYEGWPVSDPATAGLPRHTMARVRDLLDAGDPDAALTAFYDEIVPPDAVAALRASPAWPDRVATAHTIPREERAMRTAVLDPAVLRRVAVPTLLVVGSDSPARLTSGVEAVAAALPDAHVHRLDGHGHVAHRVAPALFAATVLDFMDPGHSPQATSAPATSPRPDPPAGHHPVDGSARAMQPRVLTHDVDGAGDPLVLVPGGLTGWLSWIPHQQRLRDRHRVVRVQPIHNELGSAGQPGVPGYTAAVERESLRLTLDELGIGRADFAGWSNGARSLLELAMAHPDRIRSLTLVEPPAYWVLDQLDQHPPGLAEFVADNYRLAGTDVSEDDLAAFLVMAGLADDAATARAHPAWERWVPHRAALSWITPQLMESRRTLADLAAVTCPVLLTRGTDTVAWEVAVVDALGALLPDAGVIELPGDHAHHILSIDAFLEALEAHLRRAD